MNLFQIPLLLLIINRITPLKPSKLTKAQKFIFPASFIVAAIITPTPDPLNQFLMAMPIIFLYQIGVVIIWLVNLKPRKVTKPVVAADNDIPLIGVEVEDAARAEPQSIPSINTQLEVLDLRTEITESQAAPIPTATEHVLDLRQNQGGLV